MKIATGCRIVLILTLLIMMGLENARAQVYSRNHLHGPNHSGVIAIKETNNGMLYASTVKGNVSAGHHSNKFDVSKFSCGIYFYQLCAGNNVVTRKNDAHKVKSNNDREPSVKGWLLISKCQDIEFKKKHFHTHNTHLLPKTMVF